MLECLYMSFVFSLSSSCALACLVLLSSSHSFSPLCLVHHFSSLFLFSSSLSHQCIRYQHISKKQREMRREATVHQQILTKKSTTSSGHCLYCTRKLKYQSDTCTTPLLLHTHTSCCPAATRTFVAKSSLTSGPSSSYSVSLICSVCSKYNLWKSFWIVFLLTRVSFSKRSASSCHHGYSAHYSAHSAHSTLPAHYSAYFQHTMILVC